MTEGIDEELTVEDILSEAQDTPYHTILEIWREVLKPAKAERFKKITPQWANRICSTYREIDFQHMPAFRDRYFDKVDELAEILDLEIDTDIECLNLISAEEDVEHNGATYLNILIEWQRAFLQWELDWNCTNIEAATELAAISEVHRMFFGETGITSLLDNIQFQITDADRDILAASLQELREDQEDQ